MFVHYYCTVQQISCLIPFSEIPKELEHVVKVLLTFFLNYLLLVKNSSYTKGKTNPTASFLKAVLQFDVNSLEKVLYKQF